MNKRLSAGNILLVLFCTVFIAGAARAAAQEAEPKIVHKDGLRIVNLEGSPYEIGLQHGKLLKDDIRRIYKIYLKDLVYDTWIKEYAILGKGGKLAYSNPRKAMAKFAKNLEKDIPEEYIQEMKGIADGAEIPYIEVLNMNSHIDYFAILCSTIIATGPASKDGKLVEARNLDWAQGGLRDLDKFSTVFVVKPENGHSFVSVFYPGLVGALTSVNDAKVTSELNFSMAKKNDRNGTPALLLMRKVVQYGGTLDEAEKILRDAPRLAGYNITIADGKTNDARLIEITAGVVDTLSPFEGKMVSTNHFITDKLAGQNIETSNFSSSPSGDRFNRLTELLAQNHGKIDMELAQEMIHDDVVKVSGTVQTAIFKPADQLLWVWTRDRAPGDFVKLDVADLLAD